MVASPHCVRGTRRLVRGAYAVRTSLLRAVASQVVGVIYDSIYESGTNRLATVVGGIEVAELGAPQLLQFGSDAAPLSPLMRWLRVSMIVYPQVRPGCADTVGNLTAACLEVPPSDLSLRSSLLKRDHDADEWEWVAGGELVHDTVLRLRT